MSRRKRNLPVEPVRLEIVDWSHDGRGVARNTEGKTVFVDNAIQGEVVEAKIKYRQKAYDTAVAEVIERRSPDRVQPRCAHFLRCGGCALQHVSEDRQIALKQALLERQFEHFAGVKPDAWLSPLTGESWGYRRKARLAVKYVPKKGGVLVGFREKYSHFVAEIETCHVLHPMVGSAIGALKALIESLSVKQHIPQIEVAIGDKGAALIIRHLMPLSQGDREALKAFGDDRGFDIYVQPKGLDTVRKLSPEEGEDRLFYELPAFSLQMAFHPTDFTQVNHAINRQMIQRAVDLLGAEQHEQVLDLFCGLGNFSLPLATRAGQVIGVEGSQAMVERGYENAKRNHLTNLKFFAADLANGLTPNLWGLDAVDKVLIDPPRTGAQEVCQDLLKLRPKKIVYVSCNPSTLARDAGVLVEGGYQLSAAGVMDMFPHTSHVESMAVFDMR